MLKVENNFLKLEKSNKPVYIMLCGLPGAGKTTFRNELIKNNPQYNFLTISSDDYIEEKIKEKNISYKEYYNSLDLYKWRIIHERLKEKTINGVANHRNIIVDSLNLTNKSRLKKTRLIPSDYEKMCVVFDVNAESYNLILARNKTRDIARDIPISKLNEMYNCFEYPSKEDGFFDYIYII